MSEYQDKVNALAIAIEDLLKGQEVALEDAKYIKFKHPINNKGLIWQSKDYTKQFVYNEQPDNIFSSESIDLAKGKELKINNVSIISETTIGDGVVKSNLKEVGRLKGLIVDGSFSLYNFIIFDHNTERLGIGTDQPNAVLSIVDEATEISIGARDYNKGSIGTFNNTDFQIITDDTPRISISANGNIELGNDTSGDIKVNVKGSMGVGVNSIDPKVTLHVGGAIKFNNNVHLKGSEPPSGGSFNVGDIVWNENPKPQGYVGWICTKAGNPGIWSTFGAIN